MISPTLEALRGARFVLLLADREKPAGYRSSLDDRHRQEVTLAQIEQATRYALAARLIAELTTRRIVELASQVDRGGEPQLTQPQIAEALGVSLAGVKRKLSGGLAQIERHLAEMTAKHRPGNGFA